MIRISDILARECLFADLQPGDKSTVLRTMTDRLAALGRISDSAAIHRLLMDREELMTTGVRTGFCFPHAFSLQVEESFLTLGVVREGMDFQSLDGQPVQFIFLLLGPPDNQAVHLRILARVSRLTGHPDMRRLMLEAGSPDALLQLIHDSEQHLKPATYVFPDARE